MVCFFFQAEDGIRDIGVTGVQTCAFRSLVEALVALQAHERPVEVAGERLGELGLADAGRALDEHRLAEARGEEGHERSEERRVGEECRSRWSPYNSKKKKRVRHVDP